MSPTGRCVLCGGTAMTEQAAHQDVSHVTCEVCGKYTSDGLSDLAFGHMTHDQKAMLSGFTRELFEYDSGEPELNLLDDQLQRIIETYSKKTVLDKLNNLLVYLGRKSDYFGKPLHVRKEKDYPITYSKNQDEFFLIKEQAITAGLLELPPSAGNVRLTWKGWEKLEQIRKAAEPSKKCFVAMSCADELRQIYDEGIKPAIEAIPYQPIFIEKSEHNEKICDLILAEIRASKFVVADVTLQKQNVYYEAGFAQGLGKEVIWTCRSNDMQNAHFDTRQYNHIIWESPEDLRKKLTNRIRGTII